MIYAIPQHEHAVSELQFALKGAKDATWYPRLKIIQLSMAGMSVPQLAQQFELCPLTVRHYIQAYNAGSIERLRPKKSPGRPSKGGHLKREAWDEILSRTPNQ